MKAGRVLTGTVFVLVGIILFLNNSGLLPWAIWARLIQLWPVLIIAIGFRIAFPRGILGLLPSIIIILAVLFAVFSPGYFSMDGGQRISVTTEQSLDVTTANGEFTFKLGASRVEIKSLDDYDPQIGDDKLYVAELRHLERYAPGIEYRQEGNSAFVELTSPTTRGFSMPWFNRGGISLANDVELWINPAITWSFNIHVGASKVDMDLSEIPIESVDIATGASDIHIEFGAIASDMNAHIRAGASNVRVSAPRELGVKVLFESALSSNNLGNVGFTKRDNEYFSSNYDDADKVLTIEFSSGVSNFRVDWI